MGNQWNCRQCLGQWDCEELPERQEGKLRSVECFSRLNCQWQTHSSQVSRGEISPTENKIQISLSKKFNFWMRKAVSVVRIKSTFLSAPFNEISEIFLERFSGAFSSSIIPVACSIQMLDLQSSHNVFNSLIIICWAKNRSKSEKINTVKSYSFYSTDHQ